MVKRHRVKGHTRKVGNKTFRVKSHMRGRGTLADELNRKFQRTSLYPRGKQVRPQLRSSGPGKFESGLRIDSMIYDQTLGGFYDEEIGDVQELGWFAFDVWDGPAVTRKEWDETAYENGLDEITNEEWDLLRKTAGIIVSEDNQGFVNVEYFDDKKKLMKAWRGIQKDYDEYGTAYAPQERRRLGLRPKLLSPEMRGTIESSHQFQMWKAERQRQRRPAPKKGYLHAYMTDVGKTTRTDRDRWRKDVRRADWPGTDTPAQKAGFRRKAAKKKKRK